MERLSAAYLPQPTTRSIGRNAPVAIPSRLPRRRTNVTIEFTLLGDAIWLDFVNTAKGRTAPPPDLLADDAAMLEWTLAQRLHYFQRTQDALGSRYRLERTVAVTPEQVLFEAYDQILKRRVSLRVNFYADPAIRAWFLREAEALSRLDHPAIRHVYDAGVMGELA